MDTSPPTLLFVISGALCTCVAALPLSTGPLAATLIACVCTAGLGGLHVLVNSDMFLRLPPSFISVSSGIIVAALSLVHIVTAPLIGAIVDKTHSYNAIAIALGAWVLPGVALLVLWTPPAHDVGKR